MDNRKLLIFGFIACVLAALAYTFVFADLPFATPETPAADQAVRSYACARTRQENTMRPRASSPAASARKASLASSRP